MKNKKNLFMPDIGSRQRIENININLIHGGKCVRCNADPLYEGSGSHYISVTEDIIEMLKQFENEIDKEYNRYLTRQCKRTRHYSSRRTSDMILDFDTIHERMMGCMIVIYKEKNKEKDYFATLSGDGLKNCINTASFKFKSALEKNVQTVRMVWMEENPIGKERENFFSGNKIPKDLICQALNKGLADKEKLTLTSCAAQKLLMYYIRANRNRNNILDIEKVELGEKWYCHPGKKLENRNWSYNNPVISCEVCKKIIPLMLCDRL